MKIRALLLALALAGSGADGLRQALLARLAADPADPAALIGLADLHEAAGRTRHARRYLQAFVDLVHRHPRRVEAAIRLAALRPASPFVLEGERGGFEVWRNAVDGMLAVRVPGSGLMDLCETPLSVWRQFLREGGYEVPRYWGEDGLAWLREETGEKEPAWRTFAAGGADGARPWWGGTYYEARAVAARAGKRIPAAAEWERAAGGGPGSTRTYPWGDEPAIGPDGTFRANLDRVVPARGEDDDDRDLPVDSLPEGASPFGCLHMAGNVTEWNSDPVPDHPDARWVRGGYFKQDASAGEIGYRELRTFASPDMCLLFKAGLRAAADPPAPDAGPDLGPLTDEPDPLDADRLYGTAVAAEDAGDLLRAYRFARAALRLTMAGPFRARLLGLVDGLRPAAPFVREGERWRNAIDGKEAVESEGLLLDRFETSEGDLLRFAAEGGYEIGAYWTGPRPPGPLVNAVRLGAGDLPAVMVSFEEAKAYARWARKRLPTGEEWKGLAGIGARRFPWGEEKPGPFRRLLASAEFVPEVEHDRLDDRVPVGSFPGGATPDGAEDLFGSVAEWTDAGLLLGGSTRDGWREIRKDPVSGADPESADWHHRPGFRCVADR